jgi:predicted NAD/FAD-dependent oxidoreductase
MGKKIAIIGGGVSGLACAQRLAAESESSIDSIVVFDTGNRTCGGRISSRMDKQSGYEFDHAAQYFSVKDNKTEFAEYCREATKRGELYAIDDLSRYGILMREEDKQQHYVFRRFEDELNRTPSVGWIDAKNQQQHVALSEYAGSIAEKLQRVGRIRFRRHRA